MANLFLVYNICCACGCRSWLSFLWLRPYISQHDLWESCSLSFLYDVGDYVLGYFCFLACFAKLIALCLVIPVMFLFRVSMPPSYDPPREHVHHLMYTVIWNVNNCIHTASGQVGLQQTTQYIKYTVFFFRSAF